VDENGVTATAVAVASAAESWVTTGAGPQTRDDIRRQVADRNLLARSGTLTLAVHAIDHQPAAAPANVELDFTALFAGDTPFARRQLKDPSDWQQVIMPELARAARALEAYGPRRRAPPSRDLQRRAGRDPGDRPIAMRIHHSAAGNSGQEALRHAAPRRAGGAGSRQGARGCHPT
jgi:hypothetical protein